MSGVFIINARPGQSIDRGRARSVLLANSGVAEAHSNSNSNEYVFAGDAKRTQAAIESLSADPQKTLWIIFVSVRDDCIVVYREAPQDVLDTFMPILEALLGAIEHSIVTDEEGRPFPAADVPTLSRLLTL